MGSFQQNIEFMWAWMMAGGTAFAGKSMHNADEDTELKEMKRNEVEVTQSLVPLEEAIGPAHHRPRLFQQKGCVSLSSNTKRIEDQKEKPRLERLIVLIQSADNISKKRDLLKRCLLAPDCRLVQAKMYSTKIDAFFKDPVLDDLWKQHLVKKSYHDGELTYDYKHCQQWERSYLNHELRRCEVGARFIDHLAVKSLRAHCEALDADCNASMLHARQKL